MKRSKKKRLLISLLSMVLIIGMMPASIFAANDYAINSSESTDNFYNLISKKDWDIAPGISESEIVLNNDGGSQRQVLHVMEADTTNEYVKVVNSYTGMYPEYGNYKTGTMSQQTAWVENNLGWNVVGAMNTCLSWYTGYSADRVGEPLGFTMLDAETIFDPANCGYEYGKVGFPTVLVINKDKDSEGNVRPSNIPKVEMTTITSEEDLDGWEEQVIPVSSGFIVKEGKNVNAGKPDHTNLASRSTVGIKDDGTVVIVMNDGRQAPYSAGMSMYELAEVYLDLGCTWAVNCDGGGSSAFLSQRPGEKLNVNCSPSDGAERPTTSGILFVSTAPADGAFARANISTEEHYYMPGSTVTFDMFGTDLVGNKAEIPSNITWQIEEDNMGTIKDGVFESNGKEGTVTAQVIYDGKVVGEHSVEMVVPTEFVFSQGVMTVPFDKEVTIGLSATINGGLNKVVLSPENVTFTTDNTGLGTFDGFKFKSVAEDKAPTNLTSTITAKLNGTELSATAKLSLGKGSEVLFDFEDAADIDEWNIADVNGNDEGFYQNLSYATKEDGQVHDGDGSMRVEMNPISATGISSGGYGQSDLFLDEGLVVENAQSIGFWAYIPDEYEHCWIRVLYWYDSNNDGKFESKNTISVINQPEVYNTLDESGWKYFSVDVSKYNKVLIPGLDCKEKIAYNASKNDANNFRFIEFMFPHTNTHDTWKTYGTINGLQTVYVDNITADFSDAVDDREAPIFGKVALLGNDAETVLEKYNTVTTNSNSLTVSAVVSENTGKANATGLDAKSVKAYIDGVEVDAALSNGKITIADIAVADGVHRVKFEICDNMGNKSVVVRLIEVKADVDASTIQIAPKDPTLDRLYGGSVYWMDVNANKIETIQSVNTVIDLNYGNHFELDYMELAEGFTSTYVIDEENNTATITINRTGDNTENGEATIASIPIRIIYYDTDIKINGHTAETYWNDYGFWPYDLKVDVDKGEITYVKGYETDVLNAFSNEEFSVDTEMYIASGVVDATYKSEKGTAHVHTPIALDDKAATCTEAGFKERTYCEVCESVVDWGKIETAKGHEYKVKDDKLICDCNHQLTGNDLVVSGNNKYYLINDKPVSGWQLVDRDYYYFDTQTFAAVTGEQTIDKYTYKFNEEGVLIEGSFEYTGEHYVYMWAGKRAINSWETIDGKKYFFNNSGFAATGFYELKSFGMENKYYLFADDGVLIQENGIYSDINGDIYYLNDGEALYKGLCQDTEGNYYYINSAMKAVKNCSYGISETRTNGLLPAGTYKFGADGKMIDPPTVEPEDPIDPNPPVDPEDPVDPNPPVDPEEPDEPEVKNGVVIDEDGEIRCYKDGVAQYAGLVQDAEGNYYYINSAKKAVKNCSYGISETRTNGLLPAGTYKFGADGKMIDPPTVEPEDPIDPNPPVDPEEPVDPNPPVDPEEPDEPEVKNGVVIDEDGEIRCYKDGVAQYAGLVQDAEGNYYYINSAKKAVKNCSYGVSAARTNGLLPEGMYKFGADGKMIDPPTVEPEDPIDPNPPVDPEEPVDPNPPVDPEEPDEPEIKNGLVKDEDGEIRYYIDGVAQYAGLVQDSEGNYYYINSSKKAVKNCTYGIGSSKTNGLLSAGSYKFGEDGKMIK